MIDYFIMASLVEFVYNLESRQYLKLFFELFILETIGPSYQLNLLVGLVFWDVRIESDLWKVNASEASPELHDLFMNVSWSMLSLTQEIENSTFLHSVQVTKQIWIDLEDKNISSYYRFGFLTTCSEIVLSFICLVDGWIIIIHKQLSERIYTSH